MVVNKTNLTRFTAVLSDIKTNSIDYHANKDFCDGVQYVIDCLKNTYGIDNEDINAVDVEKFKDYLQE